ncbi:MAG TPA: precorrin-6Y C5,15-methyltransferase (decarboxylating) subunit CbiT, partial [Alphaproteobacteria bacterium]|nr:precorrin-6Y C5,15-methyltransferase (decarboxylating) subunit CbiT [Alphaproteobacteria bacterium]
SAFVHDGQLTKAEIRAVTLAALAPLPGQLLWDVGAGSGAIAIEWLRAVPDTRAIAIEQAQSRLRFIERNAAVLGAPELEIVAGAAPEALRGLAPPDAIFIGGGAAIPGMFDTCWQALKPGGRLVANLVTLEAEAAVLAWHAARGGELRRLAISRAEAIGGRIGWKPLRPVTQYVVRKI